MPEGDTLEIVARRLRPFVGVALEVAVPHPRFARDRIAERLAGARITAVEARGKHLLVRFTNDLTLHSHLRMTGRWDVHRRGGRWGRAAYRAWVVLRTEAHEAVLFDGPVLELLTDAQLSLHPGLRRLGDDLIDADLDVDRAVRDLRAAHPATTAGEALLDQRLVAGIGNVWKSEALWACRVHPWARLGELDDDTLRRLVTFASEGMRRQSDLLDGRRPRAVYGRDGRPCPRCGTPIVERLQGDDGRRTFWCPTCQPGTAPTGPPVRTAPPMRRR
jgi:endonuclease-8